jgi:hypothetical protein
MHVYAMHNVVPPTREAARMAPLQVADTLCL